MQNDRDVAVASIAFGIAVLVACFAAATCSSEAESSTQPERSAPCFDCFSDSRFASAR